LKTNAENQRQQLFKWLSKATDAANEKVLSGPQLKAKDQTFEDQPVTYPKGYFYQAYKLDGVALAIYYVDGKLKQAGLRPRDGINGEDVTAQVKYVAGVPEKLPEKITCSVRGELICKLTDFEEVQRDLEAAGEKLRANPRNHTAGGIRQFKNPLKTKLMRLSFVAYSIEGLANPAYKTEIERYKYCSEVLGIPYTETTPFRFQDLAKFEKDIPKLNFEVDGVIVGVNSLEDQEQLGRHGDRLTGNPKGKIAWKFREEEATPVVKEIQWQTGRTGKLTAVAIFDAVRLAGTNVSRATLHNAGFMSRNQITIGSKIAVRKAGKIIPKVTGVIAGQGDPEFPQVCPSCEQPTDLQKGNTEDMLELVCPNTDCPAQNVSTLCHYLSTIGVLGLGESRVAQLVEADLVSVPADFYALDVETAMTSGLTVRQSSLAVAAIQMIPGPDKIKEEELSGLIDAAFKTKKQVPLWQLFASAQLARQPAKPCRITLARSKKSAKHRKKISRQSTTSEKSPPKQSEVISTQRLPISIGCWSSSNPPWRPAAGCWMAKCSALAAVSLTAKSTGKKKWNREAANAVVPFQRKRAFWSPAPVQDQNPRKQKS